MAIPSAPIPDLEASLRRLEAWLRTLQDPNLADWDGVLVLDGHDWSTAASPRDFAQRWSEICRSVDRSWVNLTAAGVRDRTLVVSVEWIPALDGEEPSPRAPGVPLLVNLSGVPRGGPFYGWDI